MSEAASVEAAMKRWSGKATFVGVAWSGSENEFQAFIDNFGLTFPQISDPDGEIFARFDIASQPALAVVSPSGDTTQFYGEADELTVDTLIEQAIDKG